MPWAGLGQRRFTVHLVGCVEVRGKFRGLSRFLLHLGQFECFQLSGVNKPLARMRGLG